MQLKQMRRNLEGSPPHAERTRAGKNFSINLPCLLSPFSEPARADERFSSSGTFSRNGIGISVARGFVVEGVRIGSFVCVVAYASG